MCVFQNNSPNNITDNIIPKDNLAFLCVSFCPARMYIQRADIFSFADHPVSCLPCNYSALSSQHKGSYTDKM